MKKFEIGTILLIGGLYTDDYEEKIIDRTNSELICKEVAYPDGEPNIHKIEVDTEKDTEYFINWEYRGERSLIYPYSTPENVYGQATMMRGV